MDDILDKTKLNSLVNKELVRLNAELNIQILRDGGVIPHTDIKYFGYSNSLTENLQQWYYRHSPSPEAMNELLQMLNDEGLGVPICVDGFGCNSRTGDNSFDDSMLSSTAPAVKKENPNATIAKIQDQQTQMNAQLKLLMHEISKAKVRLDANEGIAEEMHNSDMFPLQSVKDLVAFEESINDVNMSGHVKTLKRLIKAEDINKSLTRVLSFSILIEHNLNGTNNKLALTSYPKFLKILYRSHENLKSYDDFIDRLKEAIKRAKNRYHKSNWQQRKSQGDCKKFKGDDGDEIIEFNEEENSVDNN